MNYKRKKPRRQVRCALCTPHRLGNTITGDTPPGHRHEDPDPDVPPGFGPSTRKRRKKKPFVVEYRFVGEPRNPVNSWWAERFYPKDWRPYSRYATLAGAEQAAAALSKNGWHPGDYEYRVVEPPPDP